MKPRKIGLRFVIQANGKQVAAFDKREQAEGWVNDRTDLHPKINYEMYDLLSRSTTPAWRCKDGLVTML